MNATTQATREFHGLRWSVDIYSGKVKGYAWLNVVDGHPTPFLCTEGFGTELEALDALRLEILRYFRGRGVQSEDTDSVSNDRGDRINVGGGYR